MRILVPVDGSENSLRAVQTVAKWYPRLGPFDVRLLYVRVSDSIPPATLGERSRDDALETGNRALESAAAILDRVQVPYVSEVRDGYVPSVIMQCATSTKCDGIVMATRGMGSTVEVLGSIARQVISLANLPVTLVK